MAMVLVSACREYLERDGKKTYAISQVSHVELVKWHPFASRKRRSKLMLCPITGNEPMNDIKALITVFSSGALSTLC